MPAVIKSKNTDRAKTLQRGLKQELIGMEMPTSRNDTFKNPERVLEGVVMEQRVWPSS